MEPENSIIPITIFDVTKQDLEASVSRLSGASITDITDQAGYENVGALIRELAQIRIQITKTGKAGRDASNAYSKAVITAEKELLGIVSPLEQQYIEEIKTIDRLRAIEKHKVKLVDRLSALERFGIKGAITDEQILLMDDEQFAFFITDRRKKKEQQPVIIQETKKYKEWLQINMFDESDAYHMINNGTEVRMYRLVSTYQL